MSATVSLRTSAETIANFCAILARTRRSKDLNFSDQFPDEPHISPPILPTAGLTRRRQNWRRSRLALLVPSMLFNPRGVHQVFGFLVSVRTRMTTMPVIPSTENEIEARLAAAMERRETAAAISDGALQIVAAGSREEVGEAMITE